MVKFTVATISEQEVSANQLILDNLNELRKEIFMLRRISKQSINSMFPKEAIIKAKAIINDCIEKIGATSIEEVLVNFDLYDEIMEKIDPVRYFANEEEFKEFYNYLINTYSISNIRDYIVR